MAQRTTAQAVDKETIDPSDGSWLTAKAVMDATGITKADLVQFIRLNVLPRSMIHVLPRGRNTSRKKSYFSATLLGHIAMLKMLRDEGHAVETIARKLGPAEIHRGSPQDQSASDTIPAASTEAKETKAAKRSYFSLPTGALSGSACFVNHEMSIRWVDVAPDDSLFQTIRNEMNDDPSGSVFDVLLRASLKNLIFDWQPLFSFVYRFLEDNAPSEAFKRVAPMVSFHLEELDSPAISLGRLHKNRPIIDSCPIRFEDDKGRMRAMRLYALAVAEGTLFLFQEERWPNPHRGSKTPRSVSDAPPTEDSAAEKTPFSVISARLDNAQHLVDTLLPGTYYRLITRIWNEAERIAQSYGGQCSKRSGTEVQYIIPHNRGTDPAFDAIHCAIELREKVHEIEDSLKTEGALVARIRLNMGISSGKDYLPEEDFTASVAFMLPGGAADQAFYLSAMANGGRILITKSAFGHLSPHQMESITFGIYQDKRLIPNIFSQLSSLPADADTPPMAKEIRSLFVTCIIDLKSTGDDRKKAAISHQSPTAGSPFAQEVTPGDSVRTPR